MVTKSLLSVDRISVTWHFTRRQALQTFSITTLSSPNLFGLNTTETSAILILRCACCTVNVALVWFLTYLEYGINWFLINDNDNNAKCTNVSRFHWTRLYFVKFGDRDSCSCLLTPASSSRTSSRSDVGRPSVKWMDISTQLYRVYLEKMACVTYLSSECICVWIGQRNAQTWTMKAWIWITDLDRTSANYWPDWFWRGFFDFSSFLGSERETQIAKMNKLRKWIGSWKPEPANAPRETWTWQANENIPRH